jgi:hypothetical protein
MSSTVGNPVGLMAHGGVAQLVERLTGSQEVRGFESLRLHHISAGQAGVVEVCLRLWLSLWQPSCAPLERPVVARPEVPDRWEASGMSGRYPLIEPVYY